MKEITRTINGITFNPNTHDFIIDRHGKEKIIEKVGYPKSSYPKNAGIDDEIIKTERFWKKYAVLRNENGTIDKNLTEEKAILEDGFRHVCKNDNGKDNVDLFYVGNDETMVKRGIVPKIDSIDAWSVPIVIKRRYSLCKDIHRHE